jgi:hypothetical protein
MRSTKVVAAVAVFIAAIFGASTPAAAAPYTLTGNGDLVRLEFVSTDTIPCSDGSTATRTTETSFLAESILFSPSDAPVTVEYDIRSADIRIHDACTGGITELDGALFHGRGFYEQSDDARSAVVDAGIPLFNRTEGTDGGEVEIDLAFTATGRPIVNVELQRTAGPGETTFIRTTTKLRDAVVTGTFMLGGRDLLEDAQNVVAKIGIEKSVSKTRTTAR